MNFKLVKYTRDEKKPLFSFDLDYLNNFKRKVKYIGYN